uniref:RNA dependent RNA polymerase n=1 Tax=Rosellinia necatrix partitivirus 15 TaxID=2699383 RepID=A0A6F8QGW0_9VIRU|nr:RNA dependent RNA polymerase [Rosellinia necatrix partitivirus 15]
MAYSSIRNYFAEATARIRNEWKNFQSSFEDPELTSERILDNDTRRHYQRIRVTEEQDAQILEAEYQHLKATFEHQNDLKFEPFELFKRPTDWHPLPENRIPAPGLVNVPVFYHTDHIVLADPETSRALSPDLISDYAESYIPGDIDFGQPTDPLIETLLSRKYPEYLHILDKYCRPAGTTDATFRDFNKEQKPSEPCTEEREERILKLIDHFLDIQPSQPLHYVDTQYCKLPRVTGTGYHNRHSFKRRAHAKFSHPQEYASRPTSKGYYHNATYEAARILIHKIKMTGIPFDVDFDIIPNMPEKHFKILISKYNQFFNSYPTMLFTRNHISEREKTLKVRPVYAVDEIFIIIELMLTFPLIVQARKPTCAIMHSMETLRGSNHLIDQLAKSFRSFFTIDWSGYDQRLPRPITDCFFLKFLRRKIIISHGYASTMEYPDYPELTPDAMYQRMDNLLHFLHLWYNNMTFLSADGYAYRRLYAGVPSGLYNTQFLDSFGNLYLLIDAMIEFGFTDEEIMAVILFVLGDDNSGLTSWPIARLLEFISFLESYCLKRWNMVLSATKSCKTTDRGNIESLGYRCNYGNPRRDIEKLVAQLCYPEHGIKYRTMSARAIGLAYASCMQSRTFYALCKDIHATFLPYLDPSEREILSLRRQLSPVDTSTELELDIDFTKFPSPEDILDMISHYHGPLPIHSKWNFAHFMNPPDYAPENSFTMYEYEQKNGLTPRTAPNLLHLNMLDSEQVDDLLGV